MTMTNPLFRANGPSGSWEPQGPKSFATQQVESVAPVTRPALAPHVAFLDGSASERYTPVDRAPAPVPKPPSPSAAPSSSLNSSTTTMQYPLNTPQGHAAILNELTSLAVNKALDALKANKPDDAATALRNALGYADRLVAANAVVVTANARQGNEFHGYDANNPMGDLTPDPVFGDYDINNPAGI